MKCSPGLSPETGVRCSLCRGGFIVVPHPPAGRSLPLPSRAKGRLAGETERRTRGAFTSVDELAHRAQLPKRSIALLAQAAALDALAGHRRQAHWRAIGIERLPGALAGTSATENTLALPQPNEGEEIVADYRSLGLTLKCHPIALLRSKLDRLRVSRAIDLRAMASGRKVRIAGIVTHRQRPETASGVIFMSLEDETGLSNLIVWPSVQTAQRQPVFVAHLMVVEGELQNEMSVIHVIAQKVRDDSHWLGKLNVESRDFR